MNDTPTSPAGEAMRDEARRLRAMAELVEQTTAALIARYGEGMPEPDVSEKGYDESAVEFAWSLPEPESFAAWPVFEIAVVYSADRGAPYVRWELNDRIKWLGGAVGEGLTEEAFAHLDAVIASMTGVKTDAGG